MKSEKADGYIILVNIIELSINVFSVELKLGEVFVLILSRFDHIVRYIIANYLFDLDSIV